MAIKLNTASGSVTLTAEDGAGGASVSIPRAGVLAPDGDGSSLTGINAITDTSELTDVTVASADPESVSNVPAAGHLWINKVSGEAFICTDATTGANAFYNIGEGTGGVVPPVPWGDRGVFAGGYGYSNVMDYISIATPANAVDFGDLISAKGQLASVSNGSRGVFGGSTGGSGEEMEYITIATTGNATDFGDLQSGAAWDRYMMGATSDGSKGLFGGGGNTWSQIDAITIATTGNATDFGDLTVNRRELAATSGD
jgi:hypothetical protein